MSASLTDIVEQTCDRRDVVPANYHDRKIPFDRAIASVLLVIAAPILAALLIMVRGTSRGQAIYRQRRVGKNGKLFWVYKIRTMYQDAEAIGGPQWAKPKDSRITPVGRALRFLHLDELPQLVNVARGEMSLIGPRPERPEFVQQLASKVPNYRERLKVLPGITGLAQINLPPDDSLASVQNKVVIDCEYIKNGNAHLDLRILICTALRMFGIRHGRAPRWLGVECNLPSSTRNMEDTIGLSLEDTVVDVLAYANGTWMTEDVGRGRQQTSELEYAAVPAGDASLDESGSPHSSLRRPR